MGYRIPDVLFVGNGISRCFNNGISSWDELLASMSNPTKTAKDINKINCPEPLKAILVSKDTVNSKLKKSRNKLDLSLSTDQVEYIQSLLSLRFEDIITTNYTYELETAGLNQSNVTDKKISSLMKHTDEVTMAETKYLLHTYNEVLFNAHYNRIWHIHGELRKPSSMILEHYLYANLIGRLLEVNKKRNYRYLMAEEDFIDIKFNSWFDSFVLGDVYVLGFGFALSEIDLWWLLKRKKRENATHGKLYFYNIYKGQKDPVVTDLLDIMEAEVIDIAVKGNDWKTAYKSAYIDIESKLKTKRKKQQEEIS